MKEYLTLTLLLVFFVSANSQTLIATSNSPNATANHNQRKVVREPYGDINVAYEDIVDGTTVIMEVTFDDSNNEWSEPHFIAEGTNPTYFIPNYQSSLLIYQTLDSISRIKFFGGGAMSDTTKSCRFPIADYYYAMWIQENGDGTESVVLRYLLDTINPIHILVTKDTINEIAIANDLSMESPDTYFAIQYNGDSIQVLFSPDVLETIDTVYEGLGNSPRLTCNSNLYYYETANSFLKISIDGQLFEYQFGDEGDFDSVLLDVGNVSDICIDDELTYGYSFLFMKEGNLYHVFSYGPYSNWFSMLDTVAFNGKPISNPSIAYKEFSSEYVDFVWMEQNLNHYEIYYKRDEKHLLGNDVDEEEGKGFLITMSPNPFSEAIEINVKNNDHTLLPVLEIYNTKSQLVRKIEANRTTENNFHALWDGTDNSGSEVPAGLYVIVCTVGNNKTARKVVYAP